MRETNSVTLHPSPINLGVRSFVMVLIGLCYGFAFDAFEDIGFFFALVFFYALYWLVVVRKKTLQLDAQFVSGPRHRRLGDRIQLERASLDPSRCGTLVGPRGRKYTILRTTQGQALVFAHQIYLESDVRKFFLGLGFEPQITYCNISQLIAQLRSVR